jgi:hypothetical protein
VPGVASVTALPGPVCRVLKPGNIAITCTLEAIMSVSALLRQRWTGPTCGWTHKS